jgi:hypothetical protein
MAHYLLSAGQMMGNNPLLEAGGALNSLNSHPGITNGPEDDGSSRFFSAAPRLFSAVPMNSSHCFLLSPHIIPRILVAEIHPLFIFPAQVSSPVSATPSLVLTHGLSRKSSIVENDDE